MWIVFLLAALVLPTWVSADEVPPTPPPIPPLPSAPAVPAISGLIVDIETVHPLPSLEPPFTWLQLFRLGESGWLEWVAGTDCSAGEGCVDAEGTFHFSRRSDGSPLAPGHYVLEAQAQEYLLGRAEFDFFDETFVGVGLTHSPVQVVIIHTTAGEGKLVWRYLLVRNDGGEGLLRVYSIFSGAGETARWTSFQRPPALVKLGDTPWERTESLVVPGTIPEGSALCVTIYVTEAGNPFRLLAQSGFCLPKK